MANAYAIISRHDLTAVTNLYDDGSPFIVIRAGGVSIHVNQVEAREIARQIVALCDEAEAKEIAK